MSLTLMTYLVVGATFALYIYIAIRSKAKNTGDFYQSTFREKIRPHLAAKYFNGKKNDRTGDDSGNNDADKGS